MVPEINLDQLIDEIYKWWSHINKNHHMGGWTVPRGGTRMKQYILHTREPQPYDLCVSRSTLPASTVQSANPSQFESLDEILSLVEYPG